MSLTDLLNILEEEEEEEEEEKEIKEEILHTQTIDNEEVIKDMCVLSDIIKKEIIEDKKKSEKKFVETKRALKCTDKRKSLFVMGLLAKYLEKNGIVTAIEKKEKKEKNIGQNDLEEGNTILQFMVNGLSQKRKYNLYFDIDLERNEVLLDNKEETDKFINKLRKKLSKELSKEYNISEDSEDDIIITNPKRGRSFQLSVIFKTRDLDLTKNELIEKFQNELELKTLKIRKDLLLNACKISEGMFDKKGNKDSGWGDGEDRGGERYIPPEGWIGYGLKVWDKYDLDKGEKKNNWLSFNNSEGEWCIAYRGVGNEIERNEENVYSYDDDIKHPGKKVGNGVYCSPNPEVMERYAEIIKKGQKKYKIGLMVRVNPKKIRVSDRNADFWIVDGNDDDIRPYRILVKEIKEI